MFVGCFGFTSNADPTKRSFFMISGQATGYQGMTRDICIRACKRAHYRYAAIKVWKFVDRVTSLVVNVNKWKHIQAWIKDSEDQIKAGTTAMIFVHQWLWSKVPLSESRPVMSMWKWTWCIDPSRVWKLRWSMLRRRVWLVWIKCYSSSLWYGKGYSTLYWRYWILHYILESIPISANLIATYQISWSTFH